MKKRMFLVSLMLVAVSLPAAATSIDEVKLTAEVIQENHDQLLFDALKLSDAENKAFQPIYAGYRNDWEGVVSERVSIIKEYLEKRNSLSEEESLDLVKRFFDNAERALKVRRKWAKKALKVLPATRVLSFLQIENKIFSLMNFQLAEAIPLNAPSK